MDVQAILANNIRKIIQDRGLKQCFVAERAGFDEAAFSNMINGRKIIRAEYVPIIANVLGVTANDLFAPVNDNTASA